MEGAMCGHWRPLAVTRLARLDYLAALGQGPKDFFALLACEDMLVVAVPWAGHHLGATQAVEDRDRRPHLPPDVALSRRLRRGQGACEVLDAR